MKIAYCISAYKDAAHLGRLIDALDAGDTCFIVHIDKRVKDIEPFRKVVDSRSKAWLTGERYFVQWGSWAQVRYQRLFLKEALNADADRIFIISGQDYPLWGNDRIRRYCEDNADKAFVCGLDITALPPPMDNAQILGIVASVPRFAYQSQRLIPRSDRRVAHIA